MLSLSGSTTTSTLRPSLTALTALTALAVSLALALVVLMAGPRPAYAAAPAGQAASRHAAAAGSTYAASLTQAVADLPVATEVRTGYVRSKFKIWIDADGDGCDTREEVLISEADDAPTVGAGCSLSGGRWFSYYDGVSWTDPADLDIDHVVPLAEAWDSGARSWSDQTRQDYANDLDDYRTLVAVTDNLNEEKGDQDPADWLPPQQQCRYISDWVAVKHRWGLSVDSAEKSALADLASTCSARTITVTLAR